MKSFLTFLIGSFVMSCTSAQLVDNWKNPEITSYRPNKVLVIGITPNSEAREKYEKQIKNQMESRGSEAVMSLNFSDSSIGTEKMTEEELSSLENDLLQDGFDTILLTKIIGVENKIAYKKNYDGYDETYKKFKDEYLMYQDIYYNPDYYNEYSVYHAETSMYCICPAKDRELIWKGYIDIVDPQSIDETVNDYVKLVIVVLEEQDLIGPKIENEEKPIDAI